MRALIGKHRPLWRYTSTEFAYWRTCLRCKLSWSAAGSFWQDWSRNHVKP